MAMDLLKIRGREYNVEVEHLTNLDGTPRRHAYLLIGKRGAKYHSMRNYKNPDLLFFPLASVMNGVWLSDEGGTLRVVAQ